MPAREENTMKWYLAGLIILFSFLFIYSPLQFGDRELYWRESDYAVMSQEINFVVPVTTAHGKIIPQTYPLFPWMAAYATRILKIDTVIALRLISILSLAAITILVWEAARRTAGIQAATVAAAMMISTNIIIEKTLDGYPNTSGLMFLTAGWLTWFTFGAARGCWNRAWLYSSFFAGLSFYTIGWNGLLFFYFPLIFMRRPLTVWQKLRKPGFLAAMAVTLVFVLFWGLPRWSTGSDLPFKSNPLGGETMSDYFYQLIAFPLDTLIRFLPWTIIAWAPFCVAFHPLDKTPIFSRFLRTLFISLFFLLWLSPFTRTRDMILLAPPLSILTGINYWLLARRYANQYRNLLKIFSYAAITVGMALICFYVVPPETWRDFIPLSRGVDFVKEKKYLVTGLCNGGIITMIGIILLYNSKLKIKIWLNILLIIVSCMLFFWGMLHPYKAQENSKSQFGNDLRKALGESFSNEMVIYKDSVIDGLYGECFYLGCAVREIQSFDDIPANRKEVYLISTEVPIFPQRLWTNLLPKHMKYKDQKIYLWKGEKIKTPPKKEESDPFL